MYALVSVLFSDADNRIIGAGQAHTVYGATTAAQEATKANWLRSAGVVRYWFNNARPSGAPQSYAGVAG